MTIEFDPEAIARLGWRQASVLDTGLAARARAYAPAGMPQDASEWLVVTSHDCDVVNAGLSKEPVVEIIRATVATSRTADRQQAGGRNPRSLHIEVDVDDGKRVLAFRVHERWSIPREHLAIEAPNRFLGDKARRLIAEWLAKRYIRAAFPTAFDQRWRAAMKAWVSLLETHSRWLQGIYLRLNTLDELAEDCPYRCHLILAVPSSAKREPNWATIRDQLEEKVSAFWRQFEPHIFHDGADIMLTDELTLDDIALYQRFDADWVSFADDSPTISPVVDMAT